MNPSRVSQIATAARINSIRIVIDKMHFRGHVDAWCREYCNPNKYTDLDEVSVYC